MRWGVPQLPRILTPFRIRTPLIPNQHRGIAHVSSSTPTIKAILSTLSTDEDTQSQTLTAVGTVRTARKQKQYTFVEIGDGSTPESVQAILRPEQAHGLGTGASVAISGKWQPAPPTAEQSYELKAEELHILGGTEKTYPIQKKYHSPEYLRTLPHLRLRTAYNAVLARMRSEADYHLASFFRAKEFVRLQPPILTSSDCEGAGEVFTVSTDAHDTAGSTAGRGTGERDEQFFKSSKYLTVSAQLHLEAFVHEHPNVWTLSPTFRAEKSDTPRHVSEFWMLEAEVRTEFLDDIMDLVEDMIRTLVQGLQSSSILVDLAAARKKATRTPDGTTLSCLEERWKRLLRPSWPRLTYEEAIKKLQTAVKTGEVSFHYDPSWDAGLHLEHEKWIASEVGLGSPVFVTHYPASIKPFYMLPSLDSCQPQDPARNTVACFDLLLPEACEIVGGSIREHHHEHLLQAMKDKGIDPSNLDWYLDLRRYGSVPHGGFGLGFDRLLGYLANVENIKDVVPWPRYYGRCDC